MASQRIADLMQSTASESEIKFYFVTKSGSIDEASEDLKYSFQIIADFSSSTENLEWISEAACLNFNASILKKENVFVLEEFEGDAFHHLSLTKAIVLGPRVVINCQLTDDVVPNIASPIYTLALKNAIVCLSGINLEKRDEIHKLVGFMGGLWTKDLTESTTHLITNTVKSPKYEKAAMKQMKIMKENWIYEVWNLSKQGDNAYTTDEFIQRYKIPIFHNLVITSSGITEAEKNFIIKLISDNGGTFAGSFKSKLTDILITQPDQSKSDKFKAAVKCRKECLLIDWVKDSVKKGYALPYVSYRIFTGQSTQKVINSTVIGNKGEGSRAFNMDATQLSAIYSDVSIAETTSAPTPSTIRLEKNYKAMLKEIDMKVVMNARGCLDGCTIWLCGFDETDIDKLKKIINIGGAIRHDEHDPNVEYVIVGKPNSNDLSIIKSSENSNIVTIDWLVECINTKTTCDPKEFLYKFETSNTLTVPSPASKRNIETMQTFRRPGYVPRTLVLEDDEKAKRQNEKTLLQQYTQPSKQVVERPKEATAQPPKGADDKSKESSEEATEESELDSNLFRGLSFALVGFSEESTEELRGELDEVGATVLEMNNLSQVVDYLIVPNDTYNAVDNPQNAKEIVNDLWVQDCLNENKVVDIKYFHRAISIKPDCKPLQGSNIVFSTYTASERDYLGSLAEALGGAVNDRYIRIQSPILICSTPVGQKYQGAIKWNLPVVTCEWLKKCYELEKKVSMVGYTVGESKCDYDEENETHKDEMEQKVDQMNDSVKGVTKGIGEVHGQCDDKVTPSRHPRISAIKNSGSRQSGSPLSPRTPPPPSNVTPGGSVVTPITDFVSDLTPETRARVYAMYKEMEANETPLSKRRRLENVTLSPAKSLSELMDPFEIIDRKFIEIPKERPSTPFVEFRKRIYREFLGDKYEGTPLRAPTSSTINATTNEPTNASAIASTSGANVENVDEKVNEGEKRGGDGSTQVREFFNSIKKCRDSRPSRTNTQQMSISKCKLNDATSDTEEELPNQQPQQVEVIDWRDPEDFFKSERFLTHTRSKFIGTRYFSMSAAIEVEPDKVKEQIQNLGGVMCKELSTFDPSCTHLICSKLSQSEKISSIIAAGRWLLCPAYLEDSFKADHFLNEEDYEWGNPRAESKLPDDLDDTAIKLAKVNFKRRKELQERSEKEKRPVGIFSGVRAILHVSNKDKKASYKRLLEAGCGVVVDIGEPYSTRKQFQGVTHCFTDKKKQLFDKDKEAMKKAGVHCVTMLFLRDCLTEDTTPSPLDYLAII